MTLYHGLGIILYFAKFTTQFYQPISTTTSLHAARNFTDGVGIILELKSGVKQVRNSAQAPKFLSVSWVSSFPYENEKLFYGSQVIFEISNIIEAENVKIKHRQELAMFNRFQQSIQNESVNWHNNDKMVEALAILIRTQQNREKTSLKSEDNANSKYITKYGKELFDHFCRHPDTTKMCIRNFESLPKTLRDALFVGDDMISQQCISIIPVLKLFPYLNEIMLNDLDIEKMLNNYKVYVNVVLEYVINVIKLKQLKGRYLKSITFKSKQQNEGSHISTFKEISSKNIQQLAEHQWIVEYEFQQQNNIHILEFINDDEKSEEKIRQLQIDQQNRQQKEAEEKQQQEKQRQEKQREERMKRNKSERWQQQGLWFEEEVNRHYFKFTTKKTINIFIGSWNVNGKKPKDAIESWLLDQKTFDADIYVLGFQEIVELNTAKSWVPFLNRRNDANEPWEDLIEQTLKTAIPHSQYVQIESHKLVGTLLCIYAKDVVVPSINNVMTSTSTVGSFNVAHTGGVGIRMQIFDSEICFVCSRLSANKKNVAGRNRDYLEIMENLKFSAQNDDESLSILEHDMIFFLGDLNYQLNFDDLDHVFNKIKEKDWRFLLTCDQLSIQRDKQIAFGGFVEHEIQFQPTYQFKPTTSSYVQNKFPAWCDRILWRTGITKTTSISDVKCVKYSMSMNQMMSDHKPVYALIQYKANIFNTSKRSEIRKQIMKNKARMDNNTLPQIEIDPEEIFQVIKFGEVEQKRFIIHNTGQVSVSFRITHANHKESLPKWLKILPNRGIIRPQEKETVIFEIFVNARIVKSMGNVDRLEEVVLIRIENTSDRVVPTKFVVVTAKYLWSCFGSKIENLVKYRKPIRYIDQIDPNTVAIPLHIPKELFRLIDHLYQYGMDCESLFIQRGISTEISEIRECLDTGKSFNRYELHSVGEALVRFLESLQEPVFPVSLCESFQNNMDIDQWCRQALMRLPLSHYNAFIYVISFLREILKHSSRNHLTPEKLAYQFSGALMQSPVRDVSNLTKFKPFKILRHFLSSGLLS
eukprot:449540_1